MNDKAACTPEASTGKEQDTAAVDVQKTENIRKRHAFARTYGQNHASPVPKPKVEGNGPYCIRLTSARAAVCRNLPESRDPRPEGALG